MWLLSCDGDLLGGNSLWLRPGTQHLLGRTTSNSAGEHVRYIDHKSISRKHLLIAVAPIETGASKNVHIRSSITLTDASKSGTFINGKRLDRAKLLLEQSEAKIQLGTSSYIFYIRWHPIVLSFTGLTSAQKRLTDPLATYREQLEAADIKLVTTYLSSTTSHVIATNRNNPSCLQALAQGRWTVQYAWLDVLIKAVALLDNGDRVAGLETDFFGTWPDEKQYLVPAGNEPVQRPDQMLLPDERRADLFSGWTFIFEVEKQHDSLMPVISACGGKSLLCAVVELQTQPRAFVEGVKSYVRTSKQARLAADETLNKTAVVRWEPKDNLVWWADFHSEVESLLKRPSVQQKDFLDAILTISTSELCPSTDAMDDSTLDQAPASQTNDGIKIEIKTSPASRAGKLRMFATAQPAFKGFADFDPGQIAQVESSPEPEAEAMEVDEAQELSTRSKKRPAQALDDMLDQQLQGLDQVKRQRLTKGTTSRDTTPSNITTKAAAPKKLAKELDVKARMKEQRQREEEEARLKDEALQTILDGLTVEDMKGFVQHAELVIDLAAHRQAQPATRHKDSTWNPAWDGRPNFKAFKAQRQAPRQQRVMIPLEPIPVKQDLFSEDYFLQSATQTSSARQTAHGSVPSHGGRLTLTDTPQEPADIERDSHNQSILDTDVSLTASPQTQRNKRPLAEPGSNGPVLKKTKVRRAIGLDDQDDELSFRRRRM